MAAGVYLVGMKYIRKDGLKMAAGIFGLRGLSPQSQKQDGVDGPKLKTRWQRRVKNKMASMVQKWRG